MEKLFTLQYWFSLTPGRWQSLGMLVLGVGVFFIVLFVVSRWVASRAKKMPVRAVSRRLSNLFLLIGVLDILYWFFRDQNVPFFSGRFWLGFMVIGVVVWLVSIFKYALKKIEQEKELIEQAKTFDKYLPRKK